MKKQEKENNLKENDYFNETSNTFAGINTPADREGISPTDMVSGAVEEIMDNIEEAFTGKDKEKGK